MTHQTLAYTVNSSHSTKPTPRHEQLQIALAIADEAALQSLLLHCTPPIAQADSLGTITASIGVPLTPKKSVDGLLRFESIHCQLLDVSPISPRSEELRSSQRRDSELVRCESELHTLGQGLVLAQAIALLSHAGFLPSQIDTILNLPSEGWYKSWWSVLEADGTTTPFLRVLRTVRYTDGSFTIQYRDYFAQTKPACFKSQEHTVVVEIEPELRSFQKTLEKINYSRQQCGTDKALLIYDNLSELEAEGFISQGISLYGTRDLPVHTHANCTLCGNYTCPMQGRSDSPVVLCRRFCLEAMRD